MKAIVTDMMKSAAYISRATIQRFIGIPSIILLIKAVNLLVQTDLV